MNNKVSLLYNNIMHIHRVKFAIGAKSNDGALPLRQVQVPASLTGGVVSYVYPSNFLEQMYYRHTVSSDSTAR